MKKIFFFVALLSASMVINAVPTTSAPVPSWPANQVKSLYSDAYAFAPASLNSYNEGWWNPPTMTEEIIGEDHYLHYNGNMSGMIGWMFGDISVASMEYIHVDIWPSASTTIKMGPTSPFSPDNAVASVALTVVAEQWNSIDIPVADLLAANPNFSLNDVFQNQFTEYAALTDLCVDNVYFYTTVAPAEDHDAPTAFTAAVESTSFFSMAIKANATDASGSITYSVNNGSQVVATGMGVSGEDAIITVAGLDPDTEYSFNVIASDESGNATEAVIAGGKTLAVPAAAPAPAVAADKVKSLYSDAYVAATTVNDFRQNWYLGAELVQGKLSENDNVLFYTATADNGAHGWAFDALDATGFNKLHISIYPLNAGAFRIYPVVTGTQEADYYKDSEALIANQWNEVIFDFGALALNPMGQLGWNSYFALGSFFIDNVYFFQEDQTEGLNAVEAGVKVRKVIENGQLIIIKNGARYDVTGAQIR